MELKSVIKLAKTHQAILSDTVKDSCDELTAIFKSWVGKTVIVETVKEHAVTGAVDAVPISIRGAWIRLEILPLRANKISRLKRVIPIQDIISIKLCDRQYPLPTTKLGGS